MQVAKIEISRLKNYDLHIVNFYYLQAQDLKNIVYIAEIDNYLKA